MKHSLKATREKMRQIGLRPNIYNNMVVAAEAFDRGIKVSTSGTRGTRINMEHEGRRHFWRLGTNSLNHRLAIRCADMKEITSRLLRSANVAAPENTIFGADDKKRAWAWAEPVTPVVVKPADGLQGTDVYVDISDWETFSAAFDRVAQSKSEVLVERFHPGQDHRILVIDNQVIAATRRIAANVTGDGTSTISKLIEAKNQTRRRIHKRLVVDDIVINYLDKRDLTLDSIPADGEHVQLRGTANLHTGGDAMDATDLLTAEQIRLAEEASRAIPGLRVAGFDMLISDSGEGAVLEINSNPMISMHHFPWKGDVRDAASALLNAMFPETARPLRKPANS